MNVQETLAGYRQRANEVEAEHRRDELRTAIERFEAGIGPRPAVELLNLDPTLAQRVIRVERRRQRTGVRHATESFHDCG